MKKIEKCDENGYQILPVADKVALLRERLGDRPDGAETNKIKAEISRLEGITK